MPDYTADLFFWQADDFSGAVRGRNHNSRMSCVYLMWYLDGHGWPASVKVGRSKHDSPEQRKKSYTTGAHREMFFLHEKGASLFQERLLKRRLTRAADATGTEWFVCDDTVKKLIVHMRQGRKIHDFFGVQLPKYEAETGPRYDAPDIRGVRLSQDYFCVCERCGGTCRLRLRQMADGYVRDQPMCDSCRGPNIRRLIDKPSTPIPES